MELLAVKVADSSIAYLYKVMGKNLTIQTDSNTLCPLSQKQGELDRQSHRLLVATIVAPLPLRRLGIEDDIKRKLRQTSLNITTGCSVVARNDVAPVALTVNQQILLSQLDKRILDAGIAMRMELHRMAHNVGHLVVLAIIHALHRVHDTTLNRLEAIGNVRNGAFQDYV